MDNFWNYTMDDSNKNVCMLVVKITISNCYLILFVSQHMWLNSVFDTADMSYFHGNNPITVL